MSEASAFRVCSRCRVAMALSEFPVKNAAKGWYGSYCRPCCRDYGREHYRKNVATYVARAGAHAAIERSRNRLFVADYLLTHPCIACGESDPIVLEFDHRESGAKNDEVSRLVRTSGLGAVQAEIEKCDVRCGNCHRIRTTGQFGSYRVGEATNAYLV